MEHLWTNCFLDSNKYGTVTRATELPKKLHSQGKINIEFPPEIRLSDTEWILVDSVMDGEVEKDIARKTWLESVFYVLHFGLKRSSARLILARTGPESYKALKYYEANEYTDYKSDYQTFLRKRRSGEVCKNVIGEYWAPEYKWKCSDQGFDESGNRSNKARSCCNDLAEYVCPIHNVC